MFQAIIGVCTFRLISPPPGCVLIKSPPPHQHPHQRVNRPLLYTTGGDRKSKCGSLYSENRNYRNKVFSFHKDFGR